MIGRTNAGSGGASLNFKIAVYASEAALLAATPPENTIGIVTAYKVTSWIFGAEEPSSVSEGLVWFRTGTASAAAFNALKKNGIMVYPISAMQSVGGVWTELVVKSYQGAWVDWWNGELYDSGNEFESITGGWVESDGNTAGAVVERDAAFLKLTTGKHGTNTSIETKNLIDMAEYSTLVLTGDFNSSNSSCGWGLKDGDGNQVAFTTSEYSIDLSTLSGSYKPFMQVRNSADYFKMTKLQMVR